VDKNTLKIGGKPPMDFMQFWIEHEWMFQREPGFLEAQCQSACTAFGDMCVGFIAARTCPNLAYCCHFFQGTAGELTAAAANARWDKTDVFVKMERHRSKKPHSMPILAKLE